MSLLEADALQACLQQLSASSHVTTSCQLSVLLSVSSSLLLCPYSEASLLPPPPASQ